LDLEASIGVESDPCPYPTGFDPNDNYFFSQMAEAEKSTASGESDSPVGPVVDGSAVTQSDNASGDDGDQPPAVDGVEGRRDSDSEEDDFSAGIPELRHRELEKLIAEHLKKLRRKKTLLSDTKAASTAFDLEAMRRFNDIQLSLHVEIRKQKERVANAPAYRRAIMKKKQKKIQPAIQASMQVANLLSKTETYARRLREAAHYLRRTGELPENNQGKGGAHATLLNRPDIASGVRRFVNGDIPIEEGGFGGRVSGLVSHSRFIKLTQISQMRPHKLCRYVNKFLLPSLRLEDSISEATAVRWLTKLGFKLSRVQKGVYVDGHERPDVVEARQVFIDYMEKEVFP
jgi:hypothetical protein